MERQDMSTKEYYNVDVLHVVRSLWKRVWIIAICGVLAGAIGFCIAAFGITPTYSSSVKLYVNNSVSLGNSFSISASELTAAQGLVKTYGEILDSRETLEGVIQEAGVTYTWKELSQMITYEPARETEIMRVTVTCDDPYVASNIANAITIVLPERINIIIDGATMEVVDHAIPDLEKVAPSITKYTAIALLLGLVLSTIVLVVLALMDDTVHDEEYVIRTYDYPILGKVPDLMNAGSKSYGYYSQKKQKSGN